MTSTTNPYTTWAGISLLGLALTLTGCGGSAEPGGQAVWTASGSAPLTALSIRESSRGLWTEAAASVDHEVEFASATWQSAQVGDRLNLTLPGQDAQSFVVSHVAHYAPGTTSVVGATSDGLQQLNVTVGDSGGAGQVTGPQASWQFRLEGGKTWLSNLSTNGRTAIGAHPDDAVPVRDADEALTRHYQSLGLPGIPADVVARGQAIIAATDRPAREAARAAANTELSVLMVIDVGATNAYGGQAAALTSAASLVSVANQAYVDSGVNASLKIASTYFLGTELTGTHSQLLSAVNASTAPLDRVWIEQIKASADVVLVLIPFRQQDATSGVCGLANLGHFSTNGIYTGLSYPGAIVSNVKTAVTNSYCSVYTLAHEVGHVLGSGHDRANESNPSFTAYSYSFGYGLSGVWGDIMSYLRPQVAMFSTPLKNTCAGRVCGVADPASNSADAVRTFNNTAPLQAKRMNAGSALSGWYWNPAESGTGWAIEVVDGRSFIAYFHYADDGSPTWLAGNGTDCSSAGVTRQCVNFLRFTGGQTAVGTYKAPTASGVVITAEISFSDSFPATATAQLGSRTVPLQRYSFSSTDIGVRPDTRAVPLAQWHWDPAGSGTGMFIETQGGDTFIAYFNYDAAGNPVWQAATGKPFGTPAADGSWYRQRLNFAEFRNGQTLQGAYKNPVVANAQQYYGYVQSAVNYIALYDPTSSKNRISNNFIRYDF